MMNFLLIISAFHRDTTVEDIEKCHPKIVVIFNNVSKYEDYNLVLERIDIYKSLLLECAVEFYCNEISDETAIQGVKWKDFKKEISFDYKKDSKYKRLSEYEK